MLVDDNNDVVEDSVFEDTEDLSDNLLYQALTENPDSEDESGESDDDDFEGLEAEEGDSEEVLKTKLTAKNRILRQRGKSNIRLKDRVVELEKKLNGGAGTFNKDDIKDIIAASTAGASSGDTEAKEEQRIADLKERLEQDPTSIVEILADNQMGLEGKLAKILQDRDVYWETKMSEMANQGKPAETPEVMRLVGLLRNKEEYKNADEATLISFARDLAPLSKRVTGKRPPAMTGANSILPSDASSETVGKHYASELDKMGYGQD